jgi:hypothetical protein
VSGAFGFLLLAKNLTAITDEKKEVDTSKQKHKSKTEKQTNKKWRPRAEDAET